MESEPNRSLKLTWAPINFLCVSPGIINILRPRWDHTRPVHKWPASLKNSGWIPKASFSPKHCHMVEEKVVGDSKWKSCPPRPKMIPPCCPGKCQRHLFGFSLQHPTEARSISTSGNLWVSYKSHFISQVFLANSSGAMNSAVSSLQWWEKKTEEPWFPGRETISPNY